MTKNLLIASLLLLVSESGLAQNSMTIYDAENTRMGTLIRSVGSEPGSAELIRTEDGYLIKIGTALGEVRLPTSPGPEMLWYTSNDCSGIVYLEANSDWMKDRGGQLIIIGPLQNGFLAKVPWGVPASIDAASNQSVFEPICNQLGSPQTIPDAVAITTPHPSVYGMKYIEPGFWGYVPPFTVQVEEPDLISCSGFESCPTAN